MGRKDGRNSVGDALSWSGGGINTRDSAALNAFQSDEQRDEEEEEEASEQLVLFESRESRFRIINPNRMSGRFIGEVRRRGEEEVDVQKSAAAADLSLPLSL